MAGLDDEADDYGREADPPEEGDNVNCLHCRVRRILINRMRGWGAQADEAKTPAARQKVIGDGLNSDMQAVVLAMLDTLLPKLHAKKPRERLKRAKVVTDMMQQWTEIAVQHLLAKAEEGPEAVTPNDETGAGHVRH